MKTRYGFVSNSSSSSFVVASIEKPTTESIIDGLKVKQGDPLYFVADMLANRIVRQNRYDNSYENVQEFLAKEHGYESIAEAVDDNSYVKKFLETLTEAGFDIENCHLTTFSVSNEDYDCPISGLLYGNSIKIVADNLLIMDLYD